MKKVLLSMATIVALVSHVSAGGGDAPMPADLAISAADDVPAELVRYLGGWRGSWGGTLDSRLIVEGTDDGVVAGWYCWGQIGETAAGCSRLPENAVIEDDHLVFGWSGSWGSVAFSFDVRDEVLYGTRTTGSNVSVVEMLRATE